MLALPSLPPPSSSLLPPLSYTTDPTLNQSHHPYHHHPHHPHRRHKNAPNPRAPLPILTQEERLLTSRKTAIAMYGYSWLKPAGCTKTMLGRREEEIEREEVERQLREVEMQERIAQEADEAERQARTREMRERGELVGEGERDLDDDVPDADQTRETFEGEDGEGMEGNLDDEIPDAGGSEEDEDDDDEEDEDEAEGDASGGFGEGWTYDSRREPESDEDEDMHQRLARSDGRFSHLLPQTQTQQQRGVPRANVARAAAALGVGRAQDPDYGYDVDEREAAALADAMLDEDEMGEVSFDQEPQDMMGGDLDDDVPDADEGGWEHTDTELEESEMDISILPAAGRRSSGFPVPIPGSRRTSARHGVAMQGTRAISGNAAHQLQQQYPGMHSMRTPVLDPSALLSTSSVMADSEASAMATGDNDAAFAQNQGTRQNWLNAASARRNLFGASRLGRAPSGPAGGSGGLFTPSPRQEHEASPEAEDEQGDGAAQGHRRRRSGRILDAMGVGRRRAENRDSVN